MPLAVVADHEYMSSHDRPESRAAEEALRHLWTSYLETARLRITTLERAAAALASGELDLELRCEARTEAHRLAGSLGMFGFPDASGLALAAEAALDEPALPRDARQAFAGLVADLRRAVAAEPSAGWED